MAKLTDFTPEEIKILKLAVNTQIQSTERALTSARKNEKAMFVEIYTTELAGLQALKTKLV